MAKEDDLQPPARLRRLASWQTSRVSILGSRLFARRMPLGARGDFAVLAALEEYGPLSQAQIGRRLGLDRNDVNGILNRLEADARVGRQVNPSDRRRNIVTLTDLGRDYLTDLQHHADMVQSELLAELDPAERHQLQTLLAKVLNGHERQPS
ncbi:MarR family winged helix-turn-helix transcriptional regulator [Streptomyces sp. NPDC049936]|uniref:MarR family winged helix-turn-helix transcriptional regulator n=1 Tax=Streptomyces sp. NPDC049936 TaxID=3365599 RepID=UPI0037AB7A7B